MKSFSLPSSDELNKKRAAQAAKRRANWLSQVPDEFTLRIAAEKWCAKEAEKEVTMEGYEKEIARAIRALENE